jgi:hypothetical protein
MVKTLQMYRAPDEMSGLMCVPFSIFPAAAGHLSYVIEGRVLGHRHKKAESK